VALKSNGRVFSRVLAVLTLGRAREFAVVIDMVTEIAIARLSGAMHKPAYCTRPFESFHNGSMTLAT